MNALNWILLIALAICFAVVICIVCIIRKKIRNLDGMCGVRENDEENISVSTDIRRTEKKNK